MIKSLQFSTYHSTMKSTLRLILFVILLPTVVSETSAQTIPDHTVLDIKELPNYLKAEKRNELEMNGEITTVLLAKYFRKRFSERFFYDYNDFYKRLETYNNLYSKQTFHEKRALDHLHKYPDSTQWILPFNYLNGDAVNAYALRHLARQHKMVDIALHYFAKNKDPKYIKYFERQMQSLNAALKSGNYERIEPCARIHKLIPTLSS